MQQWTLCYSTMPWNTFARSLVLFHAHLVTLSLSESVVQVNNHSQDSLHPFASSELPVLWFPAPTVLTNLRLTYKECTTGQVLKTKVLCSYLMKVKLQTRDSSSHLMTCFHLVKSLTSSLMKILKVLSITCALLLKARVLLTTKTTAGSSISIVSRRTCICPFVSHQSVTLSETEAEDSQLLSTVLWLTGSIHGPRRLFSLSLTNSSKKLKCHQMR